VAVRPLAGDDPAEVSGHLPCCKDTNPVMAASARYTIREVFADHYRLR
jgi:hypothetical protein